ncbi:hypothetical protein GCM10009550_70720 [Actinocorallia libanotica]|uniref:Uncharacterized protein n=1 Tax=Actinocorallia libanotica TaxID=46162 RepID=A0ABN1RXJ1_9ACTN
MTLNNSGMVRASVGYAAPCPFCGNDAEFWGTQVLVDRRLRWDIEQRCPHCGQEVAICGGSGHDVPAELRDRLLSASGPVRLVLPAGAGAAVTMKVLRSVYGGDLQTTRRLFQQVREGDFSGTLPEVILLVRSLDEAGIAAEAVRSGALPGRSGRKRKDPLGAGPGGGGAGARVRCGSGGSSR